MGLVAALAGVLLAWSYVINLALGERGYLARNLLAAAGLLLLARGVGLDAGDLALSRASLVDGLRWGIATASAVGVALAVALALAPRVRVVAALLEDDRASLSARGLAYHTLLRIPLGTAVFEELAFRGVLLALSAEVLSPMAAVVWSSVVFGLWHVPPTVVTLPINGVAVATPRGAWSIAAAVAVTTLAGVVFALLRSASGSLVAPILAHWATNAGGLLAASSAQDAP